VIIWGWGGKRNEVVIDPSRRIVVIYHYFHIMFVFTVAWGAKYVLAQWTEQGWATSNITREEAAALNHGITPDINPWWKYSLLGAVGLGISVGLLAAIFSL
jgi:hypothetical protein